MSTAIMSEAAASLYGENLALAGSLYGALFYDLWRDPGGAVPGTVC